MTIWQGGLFNRCPRRYGATTTALDPVTTAAPIATASPSAIARASVVTNINASEGTAVVSVSFRACDYFQTTCTPAVFPIPSGLPYATLKEGSTLRFILPSNYGT